MPKEVSQEEFDEMVVDKAQSAAVDAVSSIFKPNETREDDVTFSEVRNMLDGEIEDRVKDGLEKAQREASRKRGHATGVTRMFPGGDGVEGDIQMKAADGKGHLWHLGDLQKEQPVEIGEGKLAADTLFFIHKTFYEKSRFSWKSVAQEAEKTHPHVSGMIRKNLSTGDFSAGGALLPTEMAQDLITFLFSVAVGRQMGFRTIEMPTGSLDFGKVTGTVTASWVGENGTINASDISTGQITLNTKKLKIVSILSNDLIRQSPRGVADIVRDHMQQQAGLTEDLALFRGSGTQNEPKGVTNWVAGSQKFDREQASAADGSTLQEIVRTLLGAVKRVTENDHNLDQGQPGWVLHNNDELGIMAVLDGEDRPSALAQQMSNGMIYGYPYMSTTNLPNNLGGGDESEIYFGDFSKGVIGETLDMRVNETQEATVTNASGGTTDLFDEDQQALRIIHEMDFALLYDTAFSVVEAVDYGADHLS